MHYYCIASQSYKGGSGRTTTTANLAVALARMGKTVLCVDLDFEAPGLHQVLDVSAAHEQVAFGSNHLVNGMRPEAALHSLIDVVAKRDPDAAPLDLRGGRVFLLPGSHDLVPVTLGKDRSGIDTQARAELQLATFLQLCADRLGVEVAFLDAASGLGKHQLYALSGADLVLLFFRWTRQHVEGTRGLLESIRSMQRDRSSAYWAKFYNKKLKLVATSVADRQEISGIQNESLRTRIQLQQEATMSRLLAAAKGLDPLFEIPEDVIMKWGEQVIVSQIRQTRYEELAGLINDEIDAHTLAHV